MRAVILHNGRRCKRTVGGRTVRRSDPDARNRAIGGVRRLSFGRDGLRGGLWLFRPYGLNTPSQPVFSIFCASAASAAPVMRSERTCSFLPVRALAASTSSSLAITHVSAFMRASPSFLAITSNRQKINTELKNKLTPPRRAFRLASLHLHQTIEKTASSLLLPAVFAGQIGRQQ